LINAIALLIFVVYGFSLSFIDSDQNIFLTFVFSGYFILGVILGVIFRKMLLRGLVTAFPLTFLSWLIAFMLFSSYGGITTLVQAFSESFNSALLAGLLFSSTTFFAVFFTAMVFRLVLLVSKRIKKAPVDIKE
jgi:drug/metabolite transporter (DMT)-like permease